MPNVRIIFLPRVVCILLLLMLFGIGRAGAAPFSLKSSSNTIWRAQDGLPQDKVNAILQSRDGYLWLATQDGLARFDGDRFTIFNTQNTPGLATNGVEQLLEDSDGALWAAGSGGISRIDHGCAVNLTPTVVNESEVRVTCQRDPHGTLWAEEGGEFFVSDHGRLKKQFSVASYDGQINIQHWAVGADGAVWVEQEDGGLLELRPGQVDHVSIPMEARRPRAILSLQCDARGVVWVGTETGVYQVRNLRMRAVEGQPKPRGRATVLVDSSGDVWALIGSALHQYQNGRFVMNSDWAGTSIASIELNASGDLICRYGAPLGVDGSRDGVGLKVNKTFVCIRAEDGLAGSPICAGRDSQGNVWIGTDNASTACATAPATPSRRGTGCRTLPLNVSLRTPGTMSGRPPVRRVFI